MHVTHSAPLTHMRGKGRAAVRVLCTAADCRLLARAMRVRVLALPAHTVRGRRGAERLAVGIAGPPALSAGRSAVGNGLGGVVAVAVHCLQVGLLFCNVVGHFGC